MQSNGPLITSLRVLSLLVVFAGLFYDSLSGLLDYASTCQCDALKYVSFAVQMLGKTVKMMSVMVWCRH